MPTGTPPPAGTPPRKVPPVGRYTSLCRSPQEGTPPWGRYIPHGRYTPLAGTPLPAWAGTPLGRYTPHPGRYPPPPRAGTPPPPGNRVRHTVNQRPVRILLECIFISFFIFFLSIPASLQNKQYTYPDSWFCEARPGSNLLSGRHIRVAIPCKGCF